MESRIFRWLSVAVVIVLSAALVAGMVLPVYTDEIGWRFQERAGFDGVDKMFSELCGRNSLAAPPWFMMPVRWYSAFFNGAFADPFWIRVSGVGYALAWVALVLWLVRRLARAPGDRAVIGTIGLGLMALGTLPLLMVWSRPEQPILLATVAMLVLAFADSPIGPRPDSTSRQAWVRSLAITGLACITISYHIKGLFLLPLVLCCLFYASRGAKAHAARITAALLTLAAVASAVVYWRDRLACPDNAVLAQAYNGTNLSGIIARISSADQAWAVFRQLIDNISIFGYVTNIGPQLKPMSYWLEYHQLAQESAFHWFLALYAAWGLALLVAAVTVITAVVSGLRDRRLDPRCVLAIVVFGIAIAWSSTQSIRNVYESKFVLPLVMLGIVLALSACRSERLKLWQNTAALFIGLFAIASPFLIGAIYAPSLARAAGQQGFIAAQPYSLSVFGFSRIEPDIKRVAGLCGMGDPARTRAVMIDDATYFPFIRSRLPQHQFGVIGRWNGDIKDPMGYLASRGSSGAVVSCGLLDAATRRRAKAVGGFCCLGPPNW